MSSLDPATIEQFVNACDTYIQFTNEYSELNASELELRAFCEFVKASKPYEQISDAFAELVVKKQEEMKTGLIIPENNTFKTGKFFAKSTNASIVISGTIEVPEIATDGKEPPKARRVERNYTMNFTDICLSIVSKNRNRRLMMFARNQRML